MKDEFRVSWLGNNHMYLLRTHSENTNTSLIVNTHASGVAW